MERRIARFSERITFQKNEVTVDKYGNHKNIWKEHYICHAYVDTWQKEESEGTLTTEQRSFTFEVRYCRELAEASSDHFRILFRGETYNILSVDLMNYQKRIIRFKAERAGRQA